MYSSNFYNSCSLIHIAAILCLCQLESWSTGELLPYYSVLIQGKAGSTKAVYYATPIREEGQPST